MRRARMAFGALCLLVPGLSRAQTPVETPLSTCQKQNEAQAKEIVRLNGEVAKLKDTVVGLSTKLTSPVSTKAPAPNPENSFAKLVVLIKTKYGRGQSCSITTNGAEIGKIEYPDLKGPDRVMDYSSGFIKLTPGDYRISMTCTPTRSPNIHSVDRDVTLENGHSYTLNTKINVWTKRLQLEGFVKD
ncbi:MAG TPA: hypothetical protein VGM13_00500 [Thermoanaerobaculia bacterium]